MGFPDITTRRRRRPAAVAAGRAGALLEIDGLRAVQELEATVASACLGPGALGALLGLSGGLDSAVLAAVAVRSLGKERVRLVYLYDRTSAARLRENARTVAAWLGVPLEAVSIEKDLAAGVYDSLPAVLTSLSGRVNRLLYRLYSVGTGESPFLVTLKAGDLNEPDRAGGVEEQRLADGGKDAVKSWPGVWYRRLVLEAEAGFTARHRCRRALLEARAATQGNRLLGAANRTEWLTGWFVKGGIDDLADQPLRGLYKTQIRQIARAVGVPARILTTPPSPDMMRGLTDEIALGLPYPALDLALDVLAGGVHAAEAAAAGVGRQELRYARRLMELSVWKRRPGQGAHLLPAPVLPEYPVDGGPTSDLRRTPQ